MIKNASFSTTTSCLDHFAISMIKKCMQNKWIVDMVVLESIRTLCLIDIISNDIKMSLKTSQLNRITSKPKFQFMKSLRVSNDFGLFKQNYRPRDSTRLIQY
jgi:hypothetical protein